MGSTRRDLGSAEIQTDFFEQIQDPAVRQQLAVRATGEAFYAGLDMGDGIDASLDRALNLVPTFLNFFEEAAKTGELPEGHTAEDWSSAIEDIDKGIRSDKEPSDTRKSLARLLLSQELRTSKSIIPTSIKRREEFSSRS